MRCTSDLANCSTRPDENLGGPCTAHCQNHRTRRTKLSVKPAVHHLSTPKFCPNNRGHRSHSIFFAYHRDITERMSNIGNVFSRMLQHFIWRFDSEPSNEFDERSN